LGHLVTRRLDNISADPGGRLFTGPRSGPITAAVLRDATHWDEVVTKIGYEHLRRHDLRHTGLTWMADAGVGARPTEDRWAWLADDNAARITFRAALDVAQQGSLGT
jgi:integrase